MNKPNLLSIGLATLGSITTFGIAIAPAQAFVTGPSTLEWDNGTNDFIEDATTTFNNQGGSFDVVFSPEDIAAVFIASGHFEDFFSPPELVDLVPPGGVLGTFDYVVQIAPPAVVPPGVLIEAEYELANDLMFTFDTDGSGDVSDGDVMATLPEGSEFLGELLVDGAVEFEKILGEWEFKIPKDGELVTFTAQSSVLEFGQTEGSPGGGYIAEGTFVKAPEPASILGLLAVSGLGFGLKRKKKQ